MSSTSKDIRSVISDFEQKKSKLSSNEEATESAQPQDTILTDFIEITDILLAAVQRAELASLESIDPLSASSQDVRTAQENAEVTFSVDEQRRIKQLVLSMLIKTSGENDREIVVGEIRTQLADILTGRSVVRAETKAVTQDKRIDPSRNLWEEFVRIRDLGSTQAEQMSTLFGMMFGDNQRLWEDFFGEDSPSFKWLSWKQPTVDGSEITLGNVLDSISDGPFKTEVKKRIEVFSKVFESAQAWHKTYASPDATTTIDHLDKYLLAGDEMQKIKESGYSPLGLDFFDIMCESVNIYQYWNADNVYIHETRTPEVPNDEMVLDEILAIPDNVLMDGVVIPRFSEIEKYYDFDRSTFRKEEYRQRTMEFFTSRSGVLLVDVPNLVAFIKKAYSLGISESDKEDILKQEVINFLRSKKIEAVQSDKLTKNGIFPIIEVGEKYQRLLPDGRNTTQINFFRETRVIPQVIAYSKEALLQDVTNYEVQKQKIRDELISSGNQNPTEAEIDQALDQRLEDVARQTEMFALAYYVGQGITAKDDDIIQLATCKMWRLLATAWYRGKYPGMEGADQFKGEILQLVVPWTQYASASVEVVDPVSGAVTRQARSLETVFSNPQMRQSADFTVIGTDIRSNYVANGVRNANNIYEMLKKGLDFDPRHMAEYKPTGDLTDKYDLVINSEITQKLKEQIIRSVIGYYVDAFSTKKRSSTDGIESHSRNWQKIGDLYQILIDVDGIRSGGVDNSMISMTPQQLEEFILEAERIGFRKAMQKWFTSLLIENHIILKSTGSRIPLDDILAMCYVLTGRIPDDQNGVPLQTKFSKVTGTPIDLGFTPEEVLMMIARTTGMDSKAKSVLNAILAKRN